MDEVELSGGTVGDRIARLRDRRGLTQQQLADQLGITRQYVSMIECGKQPLRRYPRLKAFADALGVEVPALLEEPAVVLDLTVLTVQPQRRECEDDARYDFLLSDGSTAVAVRGGPVEARTAAVIGAQRVALAFLAYAFGLGVWSLAGEDGPADDQTDGS